MWRLEKVFTFEASHVLPDHDGKCSRLHGHSWRGRVVVEGHDLVEDGPKAGMLVDYGDLGSAVAPLVKDYLDHWHLNDSLDLRSPTSERIARWVYDRLKAALPGLAAVEIEETCTCKAVYRP